MSLKGDDAEYINALPSTVIKLQFLLLVLSDSLTLRLL